MISLFLNTEYTYREIVPGLTTNNYKVTGAVNPSPQIDNINFVDLVIQDGTTGGEGVEFGGNTTVVGFIPEYMDSMKTLRGYFKLYVTLGASVLTNLVFRVVDKSDTPGNNTLKQYNIGWSSINLSITDELREGYCTVYNKLFKDSLNTA